MRSSTGGNVRWKNSDSEANEASEAQRGATSGGAGPRQLHFQKNLKHPTPNGGQRPVGLDQDKCISKKDLKLIVTNPNRNEGQRPVGFGPKGQAYWKNSGSEANEASEAQGGATSGRTRTKTVAFPKELRPPS